MSYLDIAFNFPPITSDVAAKIVDVLEVWNVPTAFLDKRCCTQLFDKRTFKLLLNAEAIQSTARLKVISAKHLGNIVDASICGRFTFEHPCSACSAGCTEYISHIVHPSARARCSYGTHTF
jgi:hypothetical protein